MTREHWKTVVLAAIAAGFVFVDLLPLRSVTIHVELPPAGEPVADKVPAGDANSALSLAVGALAVVFLIVTIGLIVWVVRRCLRHLADARKPDLADVF